MGLTRTRRKGDSKTDAGKSTSAELDGLIEYGHAALGVRGAAPLALQLDAALRLAGLYLRRATQSNNEEDARWAVTLASFVVERGRSMPPAALIELVSRAVAVLEFATEHVAEDEKQRAAKLVDEAREHLASAERLYVTALDDSIASFAIAHALIDYARQHEGADAIRARGEELLGIAVVSARAVGASNLADVALAELRAGSAQAEPPPNKRRGRRRTDR